MNFPAPPFDAITYYGMIVLTLAVVWRAALALSGGVLLTLGLVVTLSGTAAGLGVFARSDLAPPPFQAFMLVLLLGAIGLGFSPFGRTLARRASLGQLVLLQAFRLPLELLMYRAALQGIMPLSFSFAGYNFDIITGALALVIGLALNNKRQVPRWAVVAWNAWGIACLIVIAIIAATLSPTTATLGKDASQVLSWVLYFPYSWLPHVLVIIAVLGHVLITLKLRME